MTETLDFIIGGMPRGGTTAVGNLFNVPDDAYCYASETHWLPLLHEFTSRGPVPRQSLKLVETILSQQNQHVLFEMARFSVSRGAHPRALIFEESDLPKLTAALMALILQGLWGEQLLQTALPILRAHLSTRTGKRVLGEKTPNNIECFEEFGALGTKLAIMVLREPYAVLRSMTGRGKDEADVYAAPFRRDVYRRIGLWLEYNATMQRARRHADTVLLHYEDLLKEPAGTIADLFTRTGVEQSDELLARASKAFRQITKGHPWDGLNPLEIALIRSLTRAEAAATGYDDAFYDNLNYPGIPVDKADLSEAGAYAVSGIHPQADGETALWLTRRGHLALQSPPNARAAELSFWSMYPESVLARGSSAHLSLRDSNGVEIARPEVSRKSDHTAVWLDLSQTEPVLENATGALRLYSFQASHAFRPYLEVVRKLGTKRLMGTDRRELSMALTNCRFT